MQILMGIYLWLRDERRKKEAHVAELETGDKDSAYLHEHK